MSAFLSGFFVAFHIVETSANCMKFRADLFPWGDLMAALFSADAAVIAAAHSYLKAYAIDCLLTSFLFCFIGYFNGREKTPRDVFLDAQEEQGA